VSATLFGCGCLVNRDAEGLIVGVSPCPSHRSELQPELDGLYRRLCDLRTRDALPPELPAAAPDIEVVYVDDTPLDALKGTP